MDDAATSQLMQYFYYFLSRGETKAHALREAKLRLLRSSSEWAKPEYWAGFVLTGQGFQPLSKVISWWQISAAIAALVALLGLIALGRQKR